MFSAALCLSFPSTLKLRPKIEFSKVEYEYTISDTLYNIFKKQTASSKWLGKERENWSWSVFSDFGMLKTLLFRYLNS